MQESPIPTKRKKRFRQEDDASMTKENDQKLALRHSLLTPIINLDPVVWRQEAIAVDKETFDKLIETMGSLNVELNRAEITRVQIERSRVTEAQDKVQAEKSRIQELKTRLREEKARLWAKRDRIILEQVIRKVIESKYLECEELGRLLLLTCKSLESGLGERYVWGNLCRARWSCTTSIPRSLAKEQGHKWLFQALSGNRSAYEGKVQAMEIETKDVILVLSIRKLEGPFPLSHRYRKSVELLSKVIAGSEVHHTSRWNDNAYPSSFDNRLHISHLIMIHCYKEIRRASYLSGLSRTGSFNGFFKDWVVFIHRFNVKDSTCQVVQEEYSARSKDVLVRPISPDPEGICTGDIRKSRERRLALLRAARTTHKNESVVDPQLSDISTPSFII
jgi:hypothetical protein